MAPDAYGARGSTGARRRRASGSLRVRDATAMAVGGMIGGGIFSVLGVAVSLAGHLAFGCFVLGAVVAAVTARSYAGMSARSAPGSGSLDRLRQIGHPQVAGALIWLLVFGYMVAMAVYSFTFGRYVADALETSTAVARLLSVAVIAVFLAVNLRGVTVSSLTEDVVVLVKLVILGTIGAVGLAQLAPSRLTPLADQGLLGMVLGAATVFVAYEGFELICYDRDDMVAPERTLPRSLYLSVAIVSAVYIGVTVAAQMLVPDHVLVARREIAFVSVGQAALGTTGRWAAIAGAVFATGSAINATLFSTARLIRDASRTGELPASLGHERGGLPVRALVVISIAGAGMAMLPGIMVVISIAAAAFLAVYTIVNATQARVETTRGGRALASAGVVGCVLALVALVVELARDDVPGLAVLVGFAVALTLGRMAFVRYRGAG